MMIHLREGIITKIINKSEDIVEVVVDIDKKKQKAIVYPKITGEVAIGDCIGLNTTAVDLNLGTGGYHFAIYNKNIHKINTSSSGHIMKLRYTPIQIKTLTLEEQYPNVINSFKSLEGMPVAIGGIHSMLPAISCVIKDANPHLKIAYIMTDGGALPIALSNIVRGLKEKKLIDFTITIGNAFGGDFESVNLYTALIAAKLILKCDLCIVIMGPGHVGTGTKLGFTGIEIVNNANIVYSMGGTPICIPRVSFEEKRERHYGISHHFLTSMSYCSVSCHMAFPTLLNYEKKLITKQYKKYNLDKKHKIYFLDENTIQIMEKYNLYVKTMGRTMKQDPRFFQTAGACGILLNKLIS